MTLQAIDALTAERDEVLAVARSLGAHEWADASDCAGWRVQDVVAHMACAFRLIVDPSTVPVGDMSDVEASQELPVIERKGWEPAAVLAEYEEWSARGLEALAGLQVGPLGETVVPLGNLGNHPLSLLADAMVFDAFCHLRNDILLPNGPIDRQVAPADDLRLGPIMNWMTAGLPQMSQAALTPVLTDPLRFVLLGPAEGEWVLLPARGGDGIRMVGGVDEPVRATVTSTTEEFIIWGTQRRPWRDRNVEIDDDEPYAASVLDAINVI